MLEPRRCKLTAEERRTVAAPRRAVVAVYGAIALLLALVITALPFTAEGHDIYKDLRGPDGMLCCGGHECSAITNVKVLPDRSGYYLPDSDETIAADDAHPSPDNRFHRCIYATVMRWDEQERRYVPQSGYSRTRCFFAPQAFL
jgi:hypothetical protein